MTTPAQRRMSGNAPEREIEHGRGDLLDGRQWKQHYEGMAM
jgi:hypothetical protein